MLGAPALPEVFGKYRVERKLGAGGMGSVWLAYDPQLDRNVALKIPHLGETRSPDVLARFLREARAAAKLNHPNICPIHEVGEAEGVPYIAMPVLEGQPLSVYARTKPLMDQRAAATLVSQVAAAIEQAHLKGVLHRDLKPSNIFVNQKADPIVMDFGLAKFLDQNSHLTDTGTVLGTPAYMPPEQARGDLSALGPPSDVYSLGVILYELLTQQCPFQGQVLEILFKVQYEEPPLPSRYRPDLDRGLEAVCMKALSKDPIHRYASMSDFAAALSAYRGEPGLFSPRPDAEPAHRTFSARDESSAQIVSTLRTSPAPDGRRIPGRIITRRVSVVATVLAGLLLAALIAFSFFKPVSLSTEPPRRGQKQEKVARPQTGLEITVVTADTPGEVAGLKRGDVILHVNQQAVQSRGDLLGALKLPGKHSLQFWDSHLQIIREVPLSYDDNDPYIGINYRILKNP